MKCWEKVSGEEYEGSSMNQIDWQKDFPGSITVADKDGIIIYMNNRALKTFENYGGKNLIETNVLDCHPEPAKSKLKELMENQSTNVYSIEKNGIKKMIYQAPWYKDYEYAGIVELSVEIPFEIPHFVRSN
jgi:transcriptional regulator with PAS, ATPase and Fis domain